MTTTLTSGKATVQGPHYLVPRADNLVNTCKRPEINPGRAPPDAIHSNFVCSGTKPNQCLDRYAQAYLRPLSLHASQASVVQNHSKSLIKLE
ncbi:hypothetical protein RRG08_038040 [Elysia crispata]|uniref:Uncharacterized protein n=1 Tax=Elysia crispata TaxID=231223 RepID=A0AAE0ZYG5_9GAST|nr:hypothetical protein RRG08_038040 [Elysia crispata]